ncbi:100K protein [Barthadenovirus mellis]|uniref:100K protein n=1 Tax=Passerine adenovirus 1 TaxID=2779174 RepID=A0A7M4BG39_9ADEN|nr:100K protein [Passerine adenovirus 1]
MEHERASSPGVGDTSTAANAVASGAVPAKVPSVDASTMTSVDEGCVAPPPTPDSAQTQDRDDVPLDLSSHLRRYLVRQAKLLNAVARDEIEALGLAVTCDDADDSGLEERVWRISEAYEKALFFPRRAYKPSAPRDDPHSSDDDPRFNFYPPFLFPERIASHFPFFNTLPVHATCKLNTCFCEGAKEGSSVVARAGDGDNASTVVTDPSGLWNRREPASDPPERCDADAWNDEPRWSAKDLLYDRPSAEDTRLPLLRTDSARAGWVKSKSCDMKYFAFPSVGLPPLFRQVLLEKLVGDSDGGAHERSNEKKRQLAYASTIGVTMSCLRRFFRHPVVVKNAQESLHYAFRHGYVRLLYMLTDKDLSDFVTFHGVTYRNRLNNAGLLNALTSEDDRFDYVVDTIYLFLILTWQTAMDIWQQTFDDDTKGHLLAALNDRLPDLIAADNVKTCSDILADILFPDVVLTTFAHSLPDFINQSQIDNFRGFVCAKSGIPRSIVPVLPSDLVPPRYEWACPPLWPHVFLLQTAAFLTVHGDYLKRLPDDVSTATCLCDCNLCSPRRMPCYNPLLQQEIALVGSFQLVRPDAETGEGTKGAKLTPETFANAYLRLVVAEDFAVDRVRHYVSEPEAFARPLEAAVIKDAKLLATLTEIHTRRDAEMLKRGAGIYLDPESGKVLGRQQELQRAAGKQIGPGVDLLPLER